MSQKSLYQALKPFVGIILQQLGYAGMAIISKFALNKGMSLSVMVVYRHFIAFVIIAPFALVLDRKTRPKMTTSVFTKIMLLALLEPVIDQNLYYTGMKFTTATFATAMWNIVPAFAFVMAWILRLEKVDIRRFHSQAKLLGTIVTIGGAMVMTLVTGATLNFPWTKESKINHESAIASNNKHFVQGALMIIAGCVCWSCFIIVQAITVKAYPAELSLTALICLVGAIEGLVPALAFEWGNPSAWAIHFDSKLLAIFYGGIVCSGFSYYIQGMVMKDRGPVFVSSFIPSQLVIVAILSSFILSETMSLGMVIGAIIIVSGLYMNLWGKSKDNLPSESDGKALSQSDLTKSMNEKAKISSQELVAIDLTKRTLGDESV